jgi:hypothetical protein
MQRKFVAMMVSFAVHAHLRLQHLGLQQQQQQAW